MTSEKELTEILKEIEIALERAWGLESANSPSTNTEELLHRKPKRGPGRNVKTYPTLQAGVFVECSPLMRVFFRFADGWDAELALWYYLDGKGGTNWTTRPASFWQMPAFNCFTEKVPSLFLEDDLDAIFSDIDADPKTTPISILGFANNDLQFPLFLIHKEAEPIVYQFSHDPHRHDDLLCWFKAQHGNLS